VTAIIMSANLSTVKLLWIVTLDHCVGSIERNDLLSEL
jgi:hypothetical protein